jgi:hypothetical protein
MMKTSKTCLNKLKPRMLRAETKKRKFNNE